MESIEQNIEAIRQEITRIFMDANKTNREILDALQNRFPYDIDVQHDQGQDNIIINCYAYALGLGESDIYRNELASQPYRLCKYALRTCGIQSDFISFLLQEKYLQKIEPRQGCLVIYFNQEIPKHAGVLIENAKSDYDKHVRGRSGNFRAIITHRLFWVDSTYGSTVKYYQQLSTEESERHFREYLKNKGMVF